MGSVNQESRLVSQWFTLCLAPEKGVENVFSVSLFFHCFRFFFF